MQHFYFDNSYNILYDLLQTKIQLDMICIVYY